MPCLNAPLCGAVVTHLTRPQCAAVTHFNDKYFKIFIFETKNIWCLPKYFELENRLHTWQLSAKHHSKQIYLLIYVNINYTWFTKTKLLLAKFQSPGCQLFFLKNRKLNMYNAKDCGFVLLYIMMDTDVFDGQDFSDSVRYIITFWYIFLYDFCFVIF